MPALRLGVDAVNLLHDRRGIGRYARALLRHWLTARADVVQVTLLMPQFAPSRLARRLKAEIGTGGFQVARRSQAGRLDLDLVWYPWNGMTWVAPGRKVATIHDVWPFASPSANLRTRRHEQEPFRTTAAQADRIITDSNFSKSEIIKHLGVTADRIDVVHLGVDLPQHVDRATKFARLHQPYVLFVGEAEPRKDLATLIAAMRLLSDELRRSTALVIAGKIPDRSRVTEGHPKVPVVVTGEIDDAQLDALYAGAAVFVFPSRYEGFGLPVLEAMAHGTPVVAANAASIPEAGGDATLYFPAGEAAALAAQLERVLTDADLLGRLQEAGAARARAFSWQRCADRTLELFLAGGGRVVV